MLCLLSGYRVHICGVCVCVGVCVFVCVGVCDAVSGAMLASPHFCLQFLDTLADLDSRTHFDSHTLNQPNGSQIQHSFTINHL